MLDFPLLKYDQTEMIRGGVSFKGLVPNDTPVFVSDLKKEWMDQGGQLGKRGGITAEVYAFMVRTKAVPAVKALYGNRGFWQDDPACIHHAAVAIEACSVFQ